jgi:mycofactocin biosynthesis protein MftB
MCWSKRCRLTACAVSTKVAALRRGQFDLARAWSLHPQVSVRPERFGALLYHFGTRRLSFVKNPTLLAVLRELDTAATARDACESAGVPDSELAVYQTALATLAASQMIRERN